MEENITQEIEVEQKRERLIKVKVLSTNGINSLIEFEGKRYLIPSKNIAGGMTKPSIVEKGIRYGIPFEDIKLTFDTMKLCKELNNRGIWTYPDVLNNPNKAIEAIQASLGLTLKEILTFAERNKK